MVEFLTVLGVIGTVGLSLRSYDRDNRHLPEI